MTTWAICSRYILMSAEIFNSAAWFWLCAGVLVGVAIAMALSGFWRVGITRYGRTRGLAIAAGSVIAIAAVAIPLYLQLGRPDLIAQSQSVQPPHMTGAHSDSDQPRSIDAVTEQLAARLARNGGSDSDWELLAQSYEFMGRSEDAKQARARVISPALQSNTQTENSEFVLAHAAENAVLAEAHELRAQRKFAEARVAYETAIEQDAMTADGWADYADVLATQSQNKLRGAPAQAIDKALALNPNHTKALWLSASLAHEEHRYADAIPTWRRLRALIGNNESDARIVDANLAEAQQLAGVATSNSQSSAAINGSVEIDPALLSRASAGATLFIYAKSVDSPGPPLAVLRTTIAKWPVRFKLDDSMAMVPGRNLSSAAAVIVEARVSQSGQAAAASGDLQAAGTRVNPRDGKAVHLRIEKEIG